MSKDLLIVKVDTMMKDEDISKICQVLLKQREEGVIVEDAKVTSVYGLINKPVEVTLENNMFKEFRILTEVLQKTNKLTKKDDLN